MNFESVSKVKKSGFPTTLEGFGYEFRGGRLTNIKTGGPFKFEVKEGDLSYNQKHYEALGDVITEYVYDYIMKEGKLKKLYLPIDATEEEPKTFIFHSEDAFEKSKVLILIHGSGVVRAGQWARRLIINDCLDSGTQLPFIKKAQELGYGVFVLNTNYNNDIVNGYYKVVKHNGTPESHVHYVLTKIIFERSSAEHIAIIAHSYGGAVIVNLMYTLYNQLDKIFAIALTDSVHSLKLQIPPNKMFVNEWLSKHAQNWISSDEPLDTSYPTKDNVIIDCISAGTTQHELTSWSSFHSIFEFLEHMYSRRLLELQH